jgi:hypothetical protein
VVTRFRKREQVRSGVLSPPITFNAAHRQIDRIGDVFEMLVQNPLAGRERPISGEICAVSQSGAA